MYVTPHESEQLILDQKRLLRLKWPGNHLLSLLMRKKKITNFRTSDLSTPPLKIILAAETGHKLSEMPSGKCNGKCHLGSWVACANTVAKRLRMRQIEHFRSLFQSHFPVKVSRAPHSVCSLWFSCSAWCCSCFWLFYSYWNCFYR